MPYKCVTLGANVQKENTKVTSIGGYHHFRKNNHHVEKIEFVSTWSTHLPDDFGMFFQSILEFEVRETPLKFLKRSNFEGMARLIILSFEDTKLSSLPDDVFTDLVNLQELTISKSKLKYLQSALLQPLKNLRMFSGKYNEMTKLHRDLFSTNLKIDSINLSGNRLKDIRIDFTKFDNLIELYLFKCRCINSYYIKSSSTFTLPDLQKQIKKRCQVA